jgi:hypothetical protein
MSYDSLLTDSCAILRRTQGTFNTTTGDYGTATDTEVYAGPCRIAPVFSPRGTGIRRDQLGDEAVVDRSRWEFLPFVATGVQVEDIVSVVNSEDADIVGRELTVKDVAAEPSPVSGQAARWLICEDFQEGP